MPENYHRKGGSCTILIQIKNHVGFFSGVSLFVSFGCLSAAEPIAQLFGGAASYGVLCIIYVMAFLIPAILVKQTIHTQKSLVSRVCLKLSTVQVVYFVFWSSLLVAVAGFLADYLFLHTFTDNWLSKMMLSPVFSLHMPRWVRLVIFLVLTPLLQEVYLRGVLLSAQEACANTGVCILLSGLCTMAMPIAQGNWCSAFLIGCLCAYVAFVFDCVWAAVIVQVCSSACRYLMIWIADTYSPLGVWEVFLFISVLLLLLFLFLACRLLESLLIEKRILHFQRIHTWKETSTLFVNSGFAAFFLAVVIKNIVQFV